MADDFKNMPVSLSEVKSEKSMSASDWTPRDALIQLLRQIDSGERDPLSLVIAWREDKETEDGLRCFHKFSRANQAGGDDVFKHVGLLEGVKFQMLTA